MEDLAQIVADIQFNELFKSFNEDQRRFGLPLISWEEFKRLDSIPLTEQDEDEIYALVRNPIKKNQK